MTDNPYQTGTGPSHSPPPSVQPPSSVIAPPAIALMIITGIWLGILVLSLMLRIFQYATGNMVPRPGIEMSAETLTMIQVGVACFLILIHGLGMWGAWNMIKMKSYSQARSAAIISLVPCISPCYLLGIPFGIWALIAMGKPGVREAFEAD